VADHFVKNLMVGVWGRGGGGIRLGNERAVLRGISEVLGNEKTNYKKVMFYIRSG
jgi:hypothetical protein